MNPLTNVKNITKLNEREIALGTKGSWHDQYKNSAWVFIGGLPYDLTEGDIICVFSQWGEIVNINLIRDKKSGKSKGFCFLCYENQKSTILAVDNFNGIKIVGRTIRVDHVENYKPPKEREDDDEITKSLYTEGCAPKIPNREKEKDSDIEEIKLPLDSATSEKKRKKKKKEKKKNKERKKKKSKKKKVSSSDSNESSSSSSTEEEKIVVKEEKYDPGYEVHAPNASPSRPGTRPSNDYPTNDRVTRSDSPRNRSDDNLGRFRHGSEKKDFNSRANYRSNNRNSRERTAGWRNEDPRDRNDRRIEDQRDRNERRNEEPRYRNDRRNEEPRDRYNDRRVNDAKPRERSEDRFQNHDGNRSKDRYIPPNGRNQRFRERSNDRRPPSRDRLDDRRIRDRSNDRNNNNPRGGRSPPDPRRRSPEPRRRSPEPPPPPRRRSPDPRNRNFRDRSNDRRNSKSSDRRR